MGLQPCKSHALEIDKQGIYFSICGFVLQMPRNYAARIALHGFERPCESGDHLRVATQNANNGAPHTIVIKRAGEVVSGLLGITSAVREKFDVHRGRLRTASFDAGHQLNPSFNGSQKH